MADRVVTSGGKRWHPHRVRGRILPMDAAAHELAPQAARLAPKLRALADQGVYFRTSSWKYKDWCGSIYSSDRYVTRCKFSQAKFEENCLTDMPGRSRPSAVTSRGSKTLGQPGSLPGSAPGIEADVSALGRAPRRRRARSHRLTWADSRRSSAGASGCSVTIVIAAALRSHH